MSDLSLLAGPIRSAKDCVAFWALHGVPFVSMGDERSKRLRRSMVEGLRAAMPWVPTAPLPHGLFADYLWDYFPAGTKPATTLERAHEEIAAFRKVLVMFECPATPTCLIASEDLIRVDLSHQDLYVLSSENVERIWAFGHEAYGPWSVSPGERVSASRQELNEFKDRIRSSWPSVRSSADGEGYIRENRINGVVVPVPRTKRIRAMVDRSLESRGVRLPNDPLPQANSVWDRLWNYLPRSNQVSTALDEATLMLHATQRETLVIFESRRCASVIVPTKELNIASLMPEDLYLLDWPNKRWMLALPKPALESIGDSPVSPFFICLE